MSKRGKPLLHIVGCGRLGRTLARLLHDEDLANIGGVCNRSLASSRSAVAFIGAGQATTQLADLGAGDLYLIGTSDDQVSAACRALIAVTAPAEGAVFFHCSGALSSAALEAAAARGLATASVHPARSFADPLASLQSFAGTCCAFEGDEAAYRRLAPLFTSLGAEMFTIARTDKALYHAGTALAHNYAVGLFGCALACFARAGVNEAVAQRAALALLGDAFTSLRTLSPAEALTGALKRGDRATLARHLEALASDPELSELYRVVARNTLPLTDHPPAVVEDLRRLLGATPA